MRNKPARRFFLPAPGLHRMNLLNAISADSRITQAELARLCSLSLAMVNNYMKEFCAQGLVEYRRASAKIVSYLLTSAGKDRVRELRLELVEELVGLFEEAKEYVRCLIVPEPSDKPLRVVIFGTGPLAQIVFHALESANVRVIGVCDDDTALIGRDWCGREITKPSQIRYMGADAVVVANAGRGEEISRSLGCLVEFGTRVVQLGSLSRSGRSSALAESSDVPVVSIGQGAAPDGDREAQGAQNRRGLLCI